MIITVLINIMIIKTMIKIFEHRLKEHVKFHARATIKLYQHELLHDMTRG